MRIGFFHRDTYPLNEGSSVQSWQLVQQLQQQGHTIVSVSSPFPGVKNFPRKTPPWKLAAAVDVILIVVDGQFNFSVEKFSAYPLFSWKKIPVIWLLNAPIQESLVIPWYDKRWYGWDQLLRKILSLFVTSTVVVSDAVRDYAEQTLGLETNVIPNGSDPVHFKPLKKTQSTALKKLHSYYKVVWAGNGMFPWQGLDQISAVAKKLEKTHPDIVFILMTDHLWLKLPALSNLFIIPAVSYADLPNYLAEADVCLSLYNYNYEKIFYNSPMKLFDAMAMGKPIIASKLGQITQIIESGKNGVLVKNPAELERALVQLKSDKNLGKKLGAQARKDVLKYYNWDRFGAAVTEVLTATTGRY